MRRALPALRPHIGWPVFTAVLAASLCFPLAVHLTEWVDDSTALVGLGLLGGAAGAWLASHGRRPPGGAEDGRGWGQDPGTRRIWSVGLLLGAALTFVSVGETVPPLSVLFQAYGAAQPAMTGPSLLAELAAVVERLAQAFWLYGREFLLQNQAFAAQITRWGQAAVTGGVSRDNDIFLLWTGWLSWAVAFHAAAIFTQKRRPALALAPLALVVTTAVAAGHGVDVWLYVFLAVGTVLWCYGTYLQQERRWARDQTDYAPEISLDVALAGIAVSSVAVTLAFLLAWGVPWAGSLLREPLGRPTQRIASTLDRLFGGVRRPPTAGIEWRRAQFADLPLTRVLSGPPELREDPVLRVTVDDGEVSGLRQPYWRGLTYDTYTGRGWANSTGDTVRRPPPPSQVGHLGPELVQHVKLLAAIGSVRYAAARPIRTNLSASWVTRDGSDLVGWYADAGEYTVVSRPIMASAVELRSAPSDYPQEIADRYLQLPVDLPPRVSQRAQEIVGDAATAYDKAAAIEAAMRDIPYSLEVGPPPTDRDIVDHFLFEMEAGYCDYFATAMTVLARSAGVPARMATGFWTGTYDPELGFYVVSGLDAHAWVEVYFPSIGWVPFEPTPARPRIERSSPPASMSSAGSRDERSGGLDGLSRLRWLRVAAFLLLVVGVAGAVSVGAWAVQQRRAGELTTEDQVRRLYDAVWRRAGWFGWDGRAAQTPWEQIGALQGALAKRSLDVSVAGWRFTWCGADAMDDLERLGDLFVKAQYSRQGVTAEDVRAAGSAWQQVRWRLLLLWRDATTAVEDLEPLDRQGSKASPVVED